MINVEINNYNRLVILGDLHISKKEHNPLIDEMLALTNSRIILTGDLLELATRHSVGDGVYKQELTPQQQYEKVLELLYPHRSRIDFLAKSNHHARAYKEIGFDIDDMLARELGIPTDEHGLLQYQISDKKTKEFIKNVTVFVTHGSGSGSTYGGLANNLQKLERIAEAELYISGHYHKPISFQTLKIGADGKFRVKHFICNGSTMGYSGYAKAMNLPPAPICQTYIDFSDPHNIKPVVVLGDNNA